MSPSLLYRQRMPLGFGIAPGPRQPAGGHPDYAVSPKRTRIEVVARVAAGQLAGLLPPGLALLGVPRMILDAHFLTELAWLGGRGYNILRVRIPATFASSEGPINGFFMPVLWESRADPIITGREEIGYPKLYAEIPPPRILGQDYHAEGSWDGFRFLEISATGLAEQPAPASTEAMQGVLLHKYIPRTGAPDESDADYITLSPAAGDKSRLLRRMAGSGCFRFHAARWQDLPTLHHVVNRLAEIEIEEVLAASVSFTEGGGDLSDQRILRRAADTAAS